MKSWHSPGRNNKQGLLVDSNVIIDIFINDKHWFQWSAKTLHEQAEMTQLHIDKIEDLESALPEVYFKRSEMPWEAAFLAAKAFQKYRRQGGKKTRPLPDFFVGAHAAVAELALLTRDPNPYKDYFPRLKIISPSSSEEIQS
jgi:predicted nucleic acid-binding protein